MAIDCITCGKWMPDDADFCPHCGRAVIRQGEQGHTVPENTVPQSTAGAAVSTSQRTAETVAGVDHSRTATPEPRQQSAALPPPESAVPLPPPKPAAPQPAPKPASAVAPRSPVPRIATPSRSIPPRVPGPPSTRSRDAILGAPVTMNDRLLGAVAYLTFLPAVSFLFLTQYKRRHFIRFHARQSIFFWVLVAALAGLGLLASTFGLLLLWMVTSILVVLALFLTWVVLSIKALQGEWFMLPGLGNLAQHFGG